MAVMDERQSDDKVWSDLMHLVYQPFLPENLFDAILNVENQSSRGSAGETSWHVLLVEDNQINQTVVGAMLKKMGCTYSVANNGQEALDLYKESDNKYDFILMDYHMPVMDGLEATRQIRQLEEGDPIPIIALTADVTEGKVDDCLNAGMDAFIAKPINKEGLISTMKGIFAEES